MTTIKELEKGISDREVLIKKLTPEIPAELEGLRNSQAIDKHSLVRLREKEKARIDRENWKKQCQFSIGAVVTDVSYGYEDLEGITLKKENKKITITNPDGLDGDTWIYCVVEDA